MFFFGDGGDNFSSPAVDMETRGSLLDSEFFFLFKAFTKLRYVSYILVSFFLAVLCKRANCFPLIFSSTSCRVDAIDDQER